MNLTEYDWILVNSSAGKDSQAMLDYVYRLAKEQGVTEQIIVVHCDLGRIEWQGTLLGAERQAKFYGLHFKTVKREAVGDLLAEIRRRGKWPSSTERYCTSYYKRDQAAKIGVNLSSPWKGRGTCKILNCLGFRSEESPRRKKLPQFQLNKRQTCGHRQVFDWLPIQNWTLAQVWERIKQSGCPHHYAYDLGMTRLSCIFCIFAPKSQLMIAGKYNPELLDEYVQAEKEMGHTFRKELPIIEVQRAIAANEEVGPDDGKWNM